MNSVRNEEVKTVESLKKTKYIFLKNEKNLTENQKTKLDFFLQDSTLNVSAPPTPLLLRLKKITTNLYRLDAAVVCRSLIF